MAGERGRHFDARLAPVPAVLLDQPRIGIYTWARTCVSVLVGRARRGPCRLIAEAHTSHSPQRHAAEPTAIDSVKAASCNKSGGGTSEPDR